LYRYVNHTSDVCRHLAGTTTPRLRGRLVARGFATTYGLRRTRPRNTRLPVGLETLEYNRLRPYRRAPRRLSPLSNTRASRGPRRIEISGQKPLSPRAPLRPRLLAPLVRTASRGSLRASSARFVEPCDSPYVSAPDAFDSVTASRRLSTSTHASVSFRPRSKDSRLSPCRRVGRFTTPQFKTRFGLSAI